MRSRCAAIWRFPSRNGRCRPASKSALSGLKIGVPSGKPSAKRSRTIGDMPRGRRRLTSGSSGSPTTIRRCGGEPGDGDQVSGMVLNYINEEENQVYDRRRGYTEDIAVRRPWRRRGLAGALIARSLETLRERGMDEAAPGAGAGDWAVAAA